jgi:glycosyltransferase involved in cell wall biosynthesis
MPYRTKMSVIMPSFNQGRFIRCALRSIVSQAYPDLECLVIDGGSTDDTVRVLREFDSSLTYWCSERDRGQSHAFNKGLARATGDVIGWLNSDDLYLGACLFEAVEHLERNRDVDIVFSDYVFTDEVGRFVRYRREIPFDFNVYRWTADCHHANCAGFFRRRVFETIGGLDESLHYGMDFDFYLRAAMAGCRFAHVRRIWGAYRLHHSSKSCGEFGKMVEEGKMIAQRFRPRVSPLSALAMRTVYDAIRVIRKALIGSYWVLHRLPRDLELPGPC